MIAVFTQEILMEDKNFLSFAYFHAYVKLALSPLHVTAITIEISAL